MMLLMLLMVVVVAARIVARCEDCWSRCPIIARTSSNHIIATNNKRSSSMIISIHSQHTHSIEVWNLHKCSKSSSDTHIVGSLSAQVKLLTTQVTPAWYHSQSPPLMEKRSEIERSYTLPYTLDHQDRRLVHHWSCCTHAALGSHHLNHLFLELSHAVTAVSIPKGSGLHPHLTPLAPL